MTHADWIFWYTGSRLLRLNSFHCVQVTRLSCLTTLWSLRSLVFTDNVQDKCSVDTCQHFCGYWTCALFPFSQNRTIIELDGSKSHNLMCAGRDWTWPAVICLLSCVDLRKDKISCKLFCNHKKVWCHINLLKICNQYRVQREIVIEKHSIVNPLTWFLCFWVSVLWAASQTSIKL